MGPFLNIENKRTNTSVKSLCTPFGEGGGGDPFIPLGGSFVPLIYPPRGLVVLYIIFMCMHEPGY